MIRRGIYIFLAWVGVLYSVAAAESPKFKNSIEKAFSEGVVVDLREPVFCDGVLSTDKGGVITAPDIRIQARSFVYTRKTVDGEEIFHVEAAGDLMVEYQGRIFVGECMEYDFIAKEGYITTARGAITPWYFGGDNVRLCPDGSFLITEGYLTTSANRATDWQIRASKIRITRNSLLSAANVQFRFLHLPLFWLPSYHTNLCNLWKAPVRYRARWSGKLGPRIGMSYLLYEDPEWAAYLIFDYSLRRGPGGGIETYYEELDGPRTFYTKSYIANDNSVQDPNEQERYRFTGSYHDTVSKDRFIFDVSYDKLSDKYMASDYYQKGFDSNIIGPTQLTLHRKECAWMATLFTHVRLNEFQTTKQELPTLSVSLHPWTLGPTGIVSETRAQASYLSFLYAAETPGVHNFSSSRCEVDQRLHRAFNLYAFTLTPEAGGVLINYNESPKGEAVNQIVGFAGCRMHTSFHRYYGASKHVMEPYMQHQYFSASALPATDTYLFDIDDGWHQLNLVRFGVLSTLFTKYCNDDTVRRQCTLDVYSNVFLNQNTMHQSIPKSYADLSWHVTPTMYYSLGSAWNWEHSTVDHCNVELGWTWNEDFAFTTEYRRRTPWAWRKVDYENYFLDVFHTEDQLEASSVSDKRETILTHVFYRFYPTWAVDVRTRSGWNRRHEPSYYEYQVALLGQLRGSWKVRVAYQHQENDSRVTLNIGLGSNPPTCSICPTTRMARGNFD